MTTPRGAHWRLALVGRLPAALLSVGLMGVLAMPFLALLTAASPAALVRSAAHPLFAPALFLSLRTSVTALALVVIGGTPLAFWLSSARGRVPRAVEVLVALPIVVPPAVVGIALLSAYGRHGLLGAALAHVGIALPFSTAAVVMAQVVVAAPFYVQAASDAFGAVPRELLLVARTLGARGPEAFLRVAVPIALPGLVGGAAVSWARALGEFGATLLFAGNLPGTTQTMPLAIYMALESDVRTALALSLMLGAMAALLLSVLRYASRRGPRARATGPGEGPREGS